VARGLDPERRYLFVIDGGKRCARGSRGCLASVPKCSAARSTSGATWSSICRKTRQGDYNRRNPQRLRDDRVRGRPKRNWKDFPATGTHQPSAARVEEAGGNVAVHRWVWAGCCAKRWPPPIPSSRPLDGGEVARNVKRWRERTALRWTATGLLEAPEEIPARERLSGTGNSCIAGSTRR